MPLKICPTCSNEFKAAKNKNKCCSIGCAAVQRKNLKGSANPNWRGGQFNKVCCVCSVEFVAKSVEATKCPDHVKRSGYDIHNYVGRVKHTCVECGREKMVPPRDLKKLCCSVSCSNRYRNRTSKKKGTDIELVVEQYLLDHHHDFEKQVNIENIAVVDFLVYGEIVIQADGEYWHTLPGREAYDLKQDNRLISHGYTIIRVSDKEIKKAGINKVMDHKITYAKYGVKRVVWLDDLKD